MYEKALRKKGMPVSEPVGATISPEELTNRPEPKVVDTTALPSEHLTRLARKPSLAELRASEEKAKADSSATSAASSWEDYVLPGLDLLDEHSLEGRAATDPSELEEVRQILIDTLAQFGIAVAPGDITKGPTITRYEVYPAKGVRVDKIVSLERDLARATRAERINILAPIPGKDTVGIELANTRKVTVKCCNRPVGKKQKRTRKFRWRSAKMFTVRRSSPIWRKCRICWWPVPLAAGKAFVSMR